MDAEAATSRSTCPVCKRAAAPITSICIFGESRPLHQCQFCDAAFYPEPNWLERAYSTAISSMDTGIAERCLDLANVLTAFLWGRRSETFLDFGGGIGLLSRIMRDRGFDYHTSDPMAEYRLPQPECATKGPAMVSMIEVLEHLTNPMADLRAILEQSPTVFISTHLIPSGGLTPDWYYLQPETGQHIFFCSAKTLEQIASDLKVSVTSNGHNLHVLHRYPLTRWQRLVIRNQQFAWVFGHLSSMFIRRRSLTTIDAESSQAS
jgi:hypothetical protein